MDKVKSYAVYLLVIAGCGGLLFDFGGTIIGPALPYIGPADENPGSLGLFTTAQVSHLSSAVVMFYSLAIFAFLYFITAAFLLPETKGRTLEEIEKLWN